MKKIFDTIIVDDQISCIDILRNDLQSYPDIKIVSEINFPQKAETVIMKMKPSILFLDIEMPGINGVELLEDIKNVIGKNTCVVFYTAYDKYMIDAIRMSAFDYLLKPYTIRQLNLVVNRIREKLSSEVWNFQGALDKLVSKSKRIAIYTVKGLMMVKKEEILYFHYLNGLRSWEMVLTDLSVHKLKILTKSADIVGIHPSFLQISKEYIVNIDYICLVENKTLRCNLYPPFNDKELYVSRKYFGRLKEYLDML